MKDLASRGEQQRYTFYMLNAYHGLGEQDREDPQTIIYGDNPINLGSQRLSREVLNGRVEQIANVFPGVNGGLIRAIKDGSGISFVLFPTQFSDEDRDRFRYFVDYLE